MWTNMVFAQHGLGRTARIKKKNPQTRQWNPRARHRTDSTQTQAKALMLESTCTVQVLHASEISIKYSAKSFQ